jgi:hypothetical protein
MIRSLMVIQQKSFERQEWVQELLALLAILTDRNRKWRPEAYQFQYPDTALHFRFGMVKLLDYKSRMAELETSENPFAVVVLAHLQTQGKRPDAPSLKQVKFTLVRQLYERGYPRQDVINLFRFLDWSILLSKPLEAHFWQELRAFEEVQNMPYITSVERLGIEQGRKEEALAMVTRLLGRRLHQDIPEEITQRLSQLPLSSITALSESLFEFSSLGDLQTWLSAHPPD